MKIRIAEYCDFCYGVKRAVDMACKLAEANEASGTLGPLIHNPAAYRRFKYQRSALP